MIPEIAVGAASLMGSLVLGTWLSRWYFRPTAAPAAPMPALEALDKFEGRCGIEGRPTLHVRFRCGEVVCLECRNPSTSGGA